MQVAFQIHIAKQCGRLEGRERPDLWSSGSIDLLRTPGRSDFFKPRSATDPLRPTVHPSDVMRAPSHNEMFKVPSVADVMRATPALDLLRPSSHSARELDLLRSPADLLRGTDLSRAPSRVDLLRSGSHTDLWSQTEDLYARNFYQPPALAYMMGGRSGDLGLSQAIQGNTCNYVA